jgi:hypothetical protein
VLSGLGRRRVRDRDRRARCSFALGKLRRQRRSAPANRYRRSPGRALREPDRVPIDLSNQRRDHHWGRVPPPSDHTERTTSAASRPGRPRSRIPSSASVQRNLPDRLRRDGIDLPLPRLRSGARVVHVRPARRERRPAGRAAARDAAAAVVSLRDAERQSAADPVGAPRALLEPAGLDERVSAAKQVGDRADAALDRLAGEVAEAEHELGRVRRPGGAVVAHAVEAD